VSRAGESLIGVRVWWPAWRTSDRDTGIVRAVACDGSWRLLIEDDCGRLCDVAADEILTKETP